MIKFLFIFLTAIISKLKINLYLKHFFGLIILMHQSQPYTPGSTHRRHSLACIIFSLIIFFLEENPVTIVDNFSRTFSFSLSSRLYINARKIPETAIVDVAKVPKADRDGRREVTEESAEMGLDVEREHFSRKLLESNHLFCWLYVDFNLQNEEL